ncbi:sensor histidine kinase [Aeoliella sp. SH292]|uniref:sensor histidine kinase n=1 Tax=Aeoliella sp. SH292 TaxID=3454464 RepID=UPI003F9D8777
MKNQIHAWRPIAPLRTFVLVLVLTFAAEGTIMLMLPFLPPWATTRQVQGLIDATILTLIMAPVIWWLVVKPLRHLAEYRGELLHGFLQAQEEERSRIARDLHDEIGQQLTALLVGLGTVEAAPDLPSAQRLARDLRQVGATAHQEVRRLASGLRPGVLEELGLIAAVERLCEDFEVFHGVPVRLEASATVSGSLSLPAETSLYRILQESLTNIARHAQAKSVEVKLARVGDMVELSVVDDGRGLPADTNQALARSSVGLGLKSIRERAEMLRGDCIIRSADSGGTMIQVTIPLSESV